MVIKFGVSLLVRRLQEELFTIDFSSELVLQAVVKMFFGYYLG